MQLAGDGLPVKNKMIMNNIAPFNSAELERSTKKGNKTSIKQILNY